MTSRPSDFDQSDRIAHPWTIAEPGSWSELAESAAFVCRSAGLALHPMTIALAAMVALAASWTLPLTLEQLLPWLGEQGVWGTLWAWFRLAWLVLAVCVGGTVMARTISARPTRAEVWGVMGPMVASCGLCVSTYLATLAGVMLATWLAAVVGAWIGGPLGASIATLVGFAGLLTAILATALLLLAIPAIATNDADAPDAIQRAAAHLIARPGLSFAMIVLSLAIVWAVTLAALVGLGAVARAVWLDADEPAPVLVWLPNTIGLFLAVAAGWSTLTQTVLTLREVVDREDRASCWDPRPQGEAIHQAIEARATIAAQTQGPATEEPA